MTSHSRILIVEDQEFMRSLIRKALENNGFKHIDEAGDGSEALQILDKNNYNLILCDIHMQPVGGIDFVRSLRSLAGLRYDAKKAYTPVVFLTGSGDTADVLSAKSLNIQGYILKPIDPDALMQRVNSLLRQAPA